MPMIETPETGVDAQPSILSAAEPIPTPLAQSILEQAVPKQALSSARGVAAIALFSDAATELKALTTAAAAFDQGARVRLRITGEDRVRWLNGMVTNTVKGLGLGAHNYTFILNAQGRIQGDATVFACADHLILETDRSQAAHLFAHLDRFIIMDDVELAWITDETTLAVAGPHAAALLTSLALPVPEPGRFTTAGSLTVVAEDTPSAPRYSLWVPTAEVLLLWQQLLAAGATPAGSQAVEALRVLRGAPLYGVDISEKTLAQETGQSRALNFSKGCYLGQEIVERIRSRATVHRGIRQFALLGDPAAPGIPLTIDGAPAGELTSVAAIQIPGLPGQVALATVRTEALERGGLLQYAGGDATLLTAPPLTTLAGGA